jgi:3-methyl-2-oxobutanoate hydroxymethyltransferase
MSTTPKPVGGAAPVRRQTVPGIRAMKGQTPIVCLTAYTAPMARLLDPHVDLLLVGDSLGMVVYGEDSTLNVDLDTMIRHGRAVVKSSQQALVVVDMPFASYQESKAQAFRNAARVMAETGCAAVKLEGGTESAETIRHLTANGIPVMGHVGLMPQRLHAMGGFKAQGRDDAMAEKIRADAHAVAEAGAFAIVIEGTVEPLAAALTRELEVPTIGIGASVACDGQVLVIDDVLGLFADFTPRFVKRYAELADSIGEAAAAYAEDVRERRFPGPEHIFGGKPKPAGGTGTAG